MQKILTLARRELAGYFYSPMAYVITALFMLTSSLYFFYNIFRPGNEASLRSLFEMMGWAMIVAAPLLTMKLISEEYRSGTIETLMTAPVTDVQVILGKFVGVMGFYLVLLSTSIVFLILIAIFGQPDAGIALMGYLGLILLGAAFISIGIFASALTRHQILAAAVSIVIIAAFTLLMQLIIVVGVEPWTKIASKVNAMSYFEDFSRGVFDTRAVVFFVTATFFFLFISTKTLESRRWR